MKLGIIGCGTIAATYIEALTQQKDLFAVTALYDVAPERAQLLGLPQATIYGDLEGLLDSPEVDCVAISTPVHTHVQLARQCLLQGKDVLLEKPAALQVAEIEELFALAEEMGRVLWIGFHSSYGVDIDWYLEGLAQTDPVYCLDHIREIECGFYDPYWSDGALLADRIPLGGSYIDSGVNILSVCNRLLPAGDMTLQSHKAQKTEEGVVYASETVYAGKQVRLIMRTGWDLGINQKRTKLRFAGTDTVLLLDHTDQAVWQIAPNGEKKLLFRQTHGKRMVNQYIRVFQVYAGALKDRQTAHHRQSVLDIHAQLLCVET